MKIDKIPYTDSEKQEIQELETALFQIYSSGMSATGLFDTEQSKRLSEIRARAELRYIKSFFGNKAAVLDDVREILDATTKEEFEQEQDRRQKAIPAFDSEVVYELYNFESEKSREEAKKALNSGKQVALILSKKNATNFYTFLTSRLLLQYRAILYHQPGAYNDRLFTDKELKIIRQYEDIVAKYGGYKAIKQADTTAEETEIISSYNAVMSIPDEERILKQLPPDEKEIVKDFEKMIAAKVESCYPQAKDKSSHLPPKLPPLKLYVTKGFNTIRQGMATNTLTKVRPDPRYNTVIDPITGAGTVKQGSLTITIPNFTELAGFKTSTYQLLDALTVKLTESGAKSPIVALSLDEYMTKRKIKDKKEARKQAADDLEILFEATISFKEKRKKGIEPDFHDIRIIDSKGIKNGIINVSFGSAFYNILLGYPVMPYPAQLWTLNSKRNPNSFYFLRKIAEHKNMNSGKKNEDIIAVKTLLVTSPFLPAYDEVMEAGRQVEQRIIQPFERDLDALSETLKWTYCHSNNTPLTDEELKALDYSTFTSLLIKVEWNTYPDQTKRLERKAERQEQAKQRKKKPTAKAT